MLLIVKMGFRNLLRNKKRSLLTSLAIGVGLASLMLMDGFMKGMVTNMVSNVTSTYLGHGQVHDENYISTGEAKFVITDQKKHVQRLKTHTSVQHVTVRTAVTAMVSSAADTQNIQLIGVQPSTEIYLSQMDDRIIEGRYIENNSDILIGEKLKEKLGVELGERIVVTTTNIATAEITQNLFRLKGVFKVGNNEMDKAMAIVHIKASQQLIGITSGVHEIAFVLHDLRQADLYQAELQNLFTSPLKLQTWKELAPQISSMIEMSTSSTSIVVIILLLLVSLGILNTLFMSIYERLFDFSVFRALGTYSRSIVFMITSEAGCLALLSILWGFVIFMFVGGYFAIWGADYSGIDYGEMTFNEVIYLEFTWNQFITYPLVIFIFTVVVSLYPGVHAARLTLADTLKKSL